MAFKGKFTLFRPMIFMAQNASIFGNAKSMHFPLHKTLKKMTVQ